MVLDVAGIRFSATYILTLSLSLSFVTFSFVFHSCFLFSTSISYILFFLSFELHTYTRAGNELLLLPQLQESFPPVFLDAELW